jgi:NAD(P)H-hydrate epimerase
MPLPVITAEEMRAWEASTWESGIAPVEVIERVGRVLAAELMRRTRSGDRILVVAGPGNNGADAKACVRFLTDRQVVVVDATEPVSATGQLQDELSEPPDWIVDGVFGIGLNRPLDPAWAGLVDTLNRFRSFRVSIDVPSGLDATTGAVLGTAVQADETWTLGAPKTGLTVPTASAFTGRVRLFPDIGLRGRPRASGGLLWSVPGDFVGFPPRRPVDGHKGTFGHVTLLVGSQGYHGAAVLAARGALRARPGLTTLIVQPEILAVVAAQLSAPMVRSWTANLRLPENATSVVIGPGLAAKDLPVPFRDLASRTWREHEGAVLADASALDWLPPRSGLSSTLRVVTPHPGEAADMLDTTVKKVLADRVGSLREISRRLGNAWVVLKGFQTLVGRAEGPVWVNPTGNPGLGQGGTGDVLAGFLGGLLAQSRLAAMPERTLAYAVWEHGAAADRLEEASRNWSAEELNAEVGR